MSLAAATLAAESPPLREARPRGRRLSDVDLDAPRLRPLRLGQLELEHTVRYAGPNSLHVDIARDRESPQIVSDIVLCIDWFEVLVVINLDAALDRQNTVSEIHTELLPVDARHVRPHPEAIAGLIDVDIRMIVATGRVVSSPFTSCLFRTAISWSVMEFSI
jgi:hypothetical protein